MIKNIIEEEKLSHKTLPLGPVKRVIFLRLPFVILIGYALTLINFASVTYFCLGLILFNLEIEKHYKDKPDIQKFRGNKYTKLRDLFIFKNSKILVYYLIFFFALIFYIGKLAILLLFYFNGFAASDFPTNFEPEDFELYFLNGPNLDNYLLTFLPNLGVLVMAGLGILCQSYIHNIRIETLGTFRGLKTSQYLFAASIVLVLASFSFTNVSLLNLALVTIVIDYFVFWGNLRDKKSNNFFYTFAKVMQIFVMLILIFQYAAALGPVNVALQNNTVWKETCNFLGVIDLNNFIDNYKDILYLAGLFVLLVATTLYADFKKSMDILEVYKDISGVEWSEQSSEYLRSSIDLSHDQKEEEKEQEPVEERKDQVQDDQNKKGFRNNDTGLKPQNTIKRGISLAIMKVTTTFRRVGFSLRILQLGSIIVVFRCNTVFSLPLMAWLFATSLTYNIKVIYYITTFLGLPSSILTFYAIYYANIPNNWVEIPSWLGKVTFDPFWLDYILTFSLVALYCNFLRLLKEFRNHTDETSLLPSTNFSLDNISNIMIAIILKNTYYLSLLGLYLIGTYEVSIFNLVLVTFFIIFFISEDYARKGWVFLLWIVILIISTRYIWGLGIITLDPNNNEDDVDPTDGLSLTGILEVNTVKTGDIITYTIFQSQMVNFLFWFMFFFVLLQYDVYRSTIARKDIFGILRETPLAKKYLETYDKIVFYVMCLFYQGFLWFGYLIITIIILATNYNLLNTVQLLVLFIVFIVHMLRLKNHPDSAHSKMLHIWNFFVLVNILVVATKYLYKFTSFGFLDQYLENAKDNGNPFVNFLYNYTKFIGIGYNKSLQTLLIGDIFILVFSVSMRGLFKTHKTFYGKDMLDPAHPIEATNLQIPHDNTSPLLFDSHRKRTHLTQKDVYQRYITASLLKEWPIVEKFIVTISYFFTLVVFLYIALLSSLFRLSFSFFILLAIYCYYFCKVNSSAINLMKQKRISQKMSAFTRQFREWFSAQDKSQKQLNAESIYEENTYLFHQFVEMTLTYRFTVWKYAFILSTILFVASYCCQMFSSTLFENYGYPLPQIKYYGVFTAFLLGVYSENTSYFFEAFPYLMLIVMSVLELNLSQYLHGRLVENVITTSNDKDESIFRFHQNVSRDKIEDSLIQEGEEKSGKEKDEKPKIRILEPLTESLVIENIQSEKKADSVAEDKKSIKSSKSMSKKSDKDHPFQVYYDSFPVPLQITEEQKQNLKQYYENNYIYLKMKTMEGLINIVGRFVIFMLLINAINKENVFSSYYLIGACLAWGATTYDMKLIVNITYFSVALSLLQYLLLVVNLNSFTSPEPVPSTIVNPSLLAYFYGSNLIMENQFIKMLGLGFQQSDTNSLIGDHMIFLVLQLFVWGFMLRAEYIFNKLAKKLATMKFKNNAGSNQATQTYKVWRSPKYIYLKFIVNFTIVHSPRIVLVIMSIIALSQITLSNFILSILLLLNIVFVDFILAQGQLLMRKKFMTILFKLTQVVIMIFLALNAINNLPLDIFPLFMTSNMFIDEVFLFTFLQLSVDLIATEDYTYTVERNTQKNVVRGRLIAISTTYKFNDMKLYKFMDDYIEKKELNKKLQAISGRIEEWHAQFFDNPRLNAQESDKSFERADRRKISREIRDTKINPLGMKLMGAAKKDQKADSKDGDKTKSDKLSFIVNFQVRLVSKLVKIKNPFLFTTTTELYRGVLEKNKNIVKDQLENLKDFAYQEFNKIGATLSYIERFYLKLETEIHQAPSLGVSQNVQKLLEKNILQKQDSPLRSASFSRMLVNQDEMDSAKPKEQEEPAQEIWNQEEDEKAKLLKREKYAKYGFFHILFLAIQVWLSYWEYFCYLMFIIYQIYTQGLIMAIIPFAIFAYALTEETRPLFKFWSISFIYFVMIIILKFANLFLGADLLLSINPLLNHLLGPTTTFTFEIFLIIIVYIQMILEKRSGFDQGAEIMIENVNQAFVRKKVNDDFWEIKKKLQKSQLKEEEGVLPLATELPKKKQSDIAQIIEEVDEDFIKGLPKVSTNNQNNYFFRVFSFYNKKVGIEVYPAIIAVQLILAFYILAFYSAMENGQLSESITNSFKYNEFSGPMVLALFAQIAVVLIDRRIVLVNNNKEKTELDEEKGLAAIEDQNEEEEKVDDKEILKELESPKSPPKIENLEQIADKSSSEVIEDQEDTSEKYHRYSTFIKFILQIITLASFNYFMYWYLPNIQETTLTFVGYASIFFYVLYAIYFALSAFQIKYGIPEFKGRMVLMKRYTLYNSIGFKIYRAIPFFFEVKTFMDWTFTETALDLFQWLKIEDVYGQLFVTKITSLGRFGRTLGEKIDTFSKWTTGCGGITLLLLLILGPLLLFSTYNPFGSDNYVIGASTNIAFQIGNSSFTVFQNSYASIRTVDSNDKKDFAGQPALRDVDTSKIQFLAMANFSQQAWSISDASYDLFVQLLNNTVSQLNQDPNSASQLNASTPITLQLGLQFTQYQNQLQNIAPSTSSITKSLYFPDQDPVKVFTNLLNILNCSQSTALRVPQFYDSLIRLGTQQPPSGVSIGTDFLQDVYLKLICPSTSTTGTPDLTTSYWQVTTNGTSTSTGLIFYTITNNMPSFLLNFSIQAFYVGIVLVVFNVVRGALSGQILNLTLTDLPAAEELIQICEGILIARADKNLVKEEKLYYELIDILRSPEVIKLITKSAVKERMKKSPKLKTD